MPMPRSDALGEADPASPQELFARDPLNLSDRDIDSIILYMRDLRVRIEASGAMAARTRAGGKTPKEKIGGKGATRPVNTTGLFDDDEEEDE